MAVLWCLQFITTKNELIFDIKNKLTTFPDRGIKTNNTMSFNNTYWNTDKPVVINKN